MFPEEDSYYESMGFCKKSWDGFEDTFWDYTDCRVHPSALPIMEEIRDASILIHMDSHFAPKFVAINRDTFKQIGCLEEALAHALTMPRYPLLNLDPWWWAFIFDGCDPERLWGIEHGDNPPDRPKEITLYRGAVPGWERGICWTSDQLTAESFAHAMTETSERGQVFELTTAGENIAFYTNERNEQEYVLWPEFIMVTGEISEAHERLLTNSEIQSWRADQMAAYQKSMLEKYKATLPQ